MARALYTVLLYDDAPAVGTTQVYAVPSGHIVVVRHITITYTSGVAGNVTVSGDSGVPIVFEIGRGVNTISQWSGRQVLNDGDHLVVNASHTGALVRVTGYLLARP